MKQRVLSVILTMCLFLALSISNISPIAAAYESTSYPLFFAKTITVNGKNYSSADNNIDSNTIKNNLSAQIDSSFEEKNNYSIGSNSFRLSTGLFAKGSINLSANEIIISAPLVAKNDITLSASKIIIADNAFVMSQEGSVNLYCSTANVKGVVFAGNKVNCSGSNITFGDGVFGQSIVINGSNVSCKKSSCSSLAFSKANNLVRLSGYTSDDRLVVSCDSTFNISFIDVYGRKDYSESFEFISRQSSDSFDINKGSELYDNYAVVAYNDYGYNCKSEVLSIKEENDIIFIWRGADSDNDGVTDGAECWFTKTDPFCSNEFSFDDYLVVLSTDSSTACWNPVLQHMVYECNLTERREYEYNQNGYLVKSTLLYSDGSTKECQYEVDSDGSIEALWLQGTRYSVVKDGNVIRYYINEQQVKQVTSDENSKVTKHSDGTQTKISCVNGKTVLEEANTSFTLYYNEYGILSKVCDPLGTSLVQFIYDEYGRIVSVASNMYSIEYTFDQSNYAANYTFGDTQKTLQLICSGGYDKGDIVTLTDGSTGGIYEQLTKAGSISKYDQFGRPTHFTIGNRKHTVQYSSNGYIISDSIESIDTGITETKKYKYDAMGNILSITTLSSSGTSQITYGYESNVWADILTSYNGNPITYNSVGLPSHYRDGLDLSWRNGRLFSVSSGSNTINYEYDYTSKRSQKSVNGISTRYIYEGNDLIAEIIDQTPLYYTYDGNFDLIGFEWQGNQYYYQYSVFGDVIAIVDKNGTVICNYEYDLWGELLDIDGDETIALLNPIRYRGYYYDSETGFYYLHSRYYDPTTHRFLSFDDLESFFYESPEDSDGLYVYCKNCPTAYVDPSGCLAQKFTNTIISISEFESESKSIAKEINSYFSDKGKESSTTVLVYNGTFESFKTKWNAVDQSSNADHYVVIDSHGNSNGITGTVLEDIRTLKRISCNTLVLLGCDCGHYDSCYNNAAYEFCKKVTGAVIASDGTVSSSYFALNPFDTRFKSKGDKGWLKYKQQYYTQYAYNVSVTILEVYRETIYQLMMH